MWSRMMMYEFTEMLIFTLIIYEIVSRYLWEQDSKIHINKSTV